MKGKYVQFFLGMIAGGVLMGTTATAVDYLTATLSNQPIFVDGQKVEFEAYSIHDNNFVMLRDVAQAVDFGVTYDAATNSVHIDTNAHYQEEAKQTEPTQTTPDPLLEERVQATLWGLMNNYPNGTYYGNFYRSYSNGPYGMAPSNCAG